jgi:hypothetical protein
VAQIVEADRWKASALKEWPEIVTEYVASF